MVRIGEDFLQIELPQGDRRGQERGEAADDGDGRHRGVIADEQRAAAGDHVDAGGHHRGGVDQGADGRRAFHRIGKPDVQRELCRFAERAEHQAGTESSSAQV